MWMQAAGRKIPYVLGTEVLQPYNHYKVMCWVEIETHQVLEVVQIILPYATVKQIPIINFFKESFII